MEWGTGKQDGDQKIRCIYVGVGEPKLVWQEVTMRSEISLDEELVILMPTPGCSVRPCFFLFFLLQTPTTAQI